MYSFGLGSSGQLGVGSVGNTATPTPVLGRWLSGETLPTLVGTPRGEEGPGWVARRVFAGGDQSFVSVVVPGKEVSGEDAVSALKYPLTCTLYML